MLSVPNASKATPKYQPHVVAVVLIVVAMKLLLVLNDEIEYEEAAASCSDEKCTEGCFNFAKWMEYHERRLEIERKCPSTIENCRSVEEIEDVSVTAQHAALVLNSSHSSNSSRYR